MGTTSTKKAHSLSRVELQETTTVLPMTPPHPNPLPPGGEGKRQRSPADPPNGVARRGLRPRLQRRAPSHPNLRQYPAPRRLRVKPAALRIAHLGGVCAPDFSAEPPATPTAATIRLRAAAE